MNDMKELFAEGLNYFLGAWNSVKPIYAVFITATSWILFPDDVLMPLSLMLLLLTTFDIITKFYAIQKNSGGWTNAIKNGKWRSETFWNKTKKKLIDVLVLCIVCGICVRFSSIAPYLSFVGITFALFAYAVMFLRELQSIFENMIEAGHEGYRTYLILLKRKRKKIIEEAIYEDEAEKQKEDAHEDL